MTCITERQPQIIHLQRRPIINRLELLECRIGISLCVERCDRCLTPTRILAVHQLRIALLDMC